MYEEQGSLKHSIGYRMEYLLTLPETIDDPYLHVFLHGYSRIESQSPPVFYRRKWAESLNAPCLFLSDPVHRFSRKSACGWFLLGYDEIKHEVISLRNAIVKRLGIEGTVWHGPSSGGYAAVRLCMESGTGDLAFTVAPHNDPTNVPQWDEEISHISQASQLSAPIPLVNLAEKWSEVPDRLLYCLISEKDAHFAHKHLKPLLHGYNEFENVRAVVLRNGLGHGFISDADYSAQLESARQEWGCHRARTGTAIAGGDSL
ncbi:hypothetical protein [Streptomyces sp. NPDC006285]|uniref:hypothetical protein n=1 Tax=Streptomyces sp. NPDC006285 TaxID=3364742 RepID=UPI0036BEB9EA